MDGPYHYWGEVLIQAHQFRDFILRAHEEWEIIRIPHFEWEEVKRSDQARKDYLLKKLANHTQLLHPLALARFNEINISENKCNVANTTLNQGNNSFGLFYQPSATVEQINRDLDLIENSACKNTNCN